VGDELVEFFEGAFVEQQFDALAGGELAFFVLALAAFGGRRPARRRATLIALIRDIPWAWLGFGLALVLGYLFSVG
jgi:hypothetical protein